MSYLMYSKELPHIPYDNEPGNREENDVMLVYDPFIGKWVKKRKQRRMSNSKVIARIIKREQKRLERGKEPKNVVLLRKHKPALLKKYRPDLLKLKKPKVKTLKKKKAPTITTRQVLTKHKIANRAIREELKTKQEEQKTIGLSKKVAQEDLKAENIKAKTQLASSGRSFIWIAAIVGGCWVLSKVQKQIKL